MTPPDALRDRHLPLPPARAGRWALFLDADGTLLDIAPTPSAIVVPDALRTTLRRLVARLEGAVVIVSGRPLPTLTALFGDLGPVLVGQHGAEIAPLLAGWHAPALDDEGLARARREAAMAATRTPWLSFEDKGLSFALHYRAAGADQAEIERLAGALVAASAGALEAVPGRHVVEFVPAGIGKGRAVERLMAEAPYAERLPVFVGDDIADEAGFKAANRLGGLSVRAASAENSARATAARYELAGPAAVRAWLAAL
jgi:trehalose 6-phosphate phosphatase